MSGGSWDYLYGRVRDAAERLQAEPSALRQDLGRHVALVATALRAVEWLDSGDYGEEHEDEIRPCLSPETIDSIKLAEWTARARAAELASERKEYLLELLSQASTKEGRIVVAIGVDPKHPALFIQSNHGDEEGALNRLMGAVGPLLRLLSATIRAAEGKRAEVERDKLELEQVKAELADAEEECVRLRARLDRLAGL